MVSEVDVAASSKHAVHADIHCFRHWRNCLAGSESSGKMIAFKTTSASPWAQAWSRLQVKIKSEPILSRNFINAMIARHLQTLDCLCDSLGWICKKQALRRPYCKLEVAAPDKSTMCRHSSPSQVSAAGLIHLHELQWMPSKAQLRFTSKLTIGPCQNACTLTWHSWWRNCCFDWWYLTLPYNPLHWSRWCIGHNGKQRFMNPCMLTFMQSVDNAEYLRQDLDLYSNAFLHASCKQRNISSNESFTCSKFMHTAFDPEKGDFQHMTLLVWKQAIALDMIHNCQSTVVSAWRRRKKFCIVKIIAESTRRVNQASTTLGYQDWLMEANVPAT